MAVLVGCPTSGPSRSLLSVISHLIFNRCRKFRFSNASPSQLSSGEDSYPRTSFACYRLLRRPVQWHYAAGTLRLLDIP